MSRILVVDVGNSRLKWGLAGPHGWIVFGVTPNTDIGTLALRDWQNIPRPSRVVGVNVAGEAARMRVEPQLARWRVSPRWLTATASACGVVNQYTNPGQLGPDRWAALVAARQRVVSGDEPPAPAVVVNAGTAVTIDALDANGVFRGGIILPGLRLMLQALAEKTAALKVPAGNFADFPRNTADAIYSGAMQAVAGAIEQARTRLRGESSAVRCFLAGGAAAEIAPHVAAPMEQVDHLVLEGTLALAEAA